MTYKVTLKPALQTIVAKPGEPILEAALRAGINLPHSCRGGSCGSCRARVVSGRFEYPHGKPPGITDDEAAQGMALLCQARAASDLTVQVREIVRAGTPAVRRLPCRIAHMERAAPDVMLLTLRLPTVERLQFLAGQYLDIVLPGGHRRSFSIASPPSSDQRLDLHIRHVDGGVFTDAVFATFREKTLLRFEGPLGSFFVREGDSRPLLLMAGGTGFAPIRSILLHLFEANDPRPAHFFWGARRRVDLYCDAEVRGWVAQRDGFLYTPVLSQPDDDGGPEARGWVHEVLLQHYPELQQFDIYMAGPPPMIDAARHAFAAAGLPEEQLYFDSFEFAPETVEAMRQRP